MIRVMSALALAAVLGGCMTTRVVQRDGCWVRETKKTLGGKTEELGPCVRPPPQWSEDRLTRLVQECVAQADYRWASRALAAWSERRSVPAQPSEAEVIRSCLNETATSSVAQNETLRERLAELSSEHAALRAEAEQGESHLRASHDRIAEWLGEAAKRPPPVATATATATSDGTATTENGLQSEMGASSQALPATAPAPIVTATQPAAPPAAEAFQRARTARSWRSLDAASPPSPVRSSSSATGTSAQCPSFR